MVLNRERKGENKHRSAFDRSYQSPNHDVLILDNKYSLQRIALVIIFYSNIVLKHNETMTLWGYFWGQIIYNKSLSFCDYMGLLMQAFNDRFWNQASITYKVQS